MWTIGLLVLVSLLIAGVMLAGSHRQRAFQREAESMVASVFVDSGIRPKVTVGHSYGYPTFQVEFASKEALARASNGGLSAALQDAIQARFKAAGSRKYPFDASRAVWFTSSEELEAISQLDRGRR
jgi:hypothetical protein